MHTDAQCRRMVARLRADRLVPLLLGCARLAGCIVAFGVGAAVISGCGSKEVVNSALQIRDDRLDIAIARGKGFIASGESPEDALAYRLVDVNQRVSSEVVLRTAGLCLPEDRIVYEIAKSGDSSDGGVRAATARGLKAVEHEVMFVAEIQLPKTMDPAAITFALRTSSAIEYPPIAVETPVLEREFTPAYDPTAPPAAMYYYAVHFPVRGGPGIPPIGPVVNALTLLVGQGTAQASYTVDLPRMRQ